MRPGCIIVYMIELLALLIDLEIWIPRKSLISPSSVRRKSVLSDLHRRLMVLSLSAKMRQSLV